MSRTAVLFALLVSSCYDTPDPGACTSIPLPDPVETDCDESADLDGDGTIDCYDTDIDGDELRNVWDCEPFKPGTPEDPPQPPAGGRCEDPDDRADGDLNVVAGDELEWETIRTSLALDAAAGSTTLNVSDGSEFKEGDEILVINQQGDGAGTYEFVMVADADDESITVEPYLANDYDSADIVSIQRVPHYDSVTINGDITTRGWDDRGTGIIMFRACGDVDVSGTVGVEAAGFPGGDGVAGNDDAPTTGTSWNGPGSEPDVATDETETYEVGARNEGGGGAPVQHEDGELTDQSAGGGGASFKTVGEYSYSEDGEKYAQPGDKYGETDLSVWYLGSGGGGGLPDYEPDDGSDPENISGGGGAGGGIVTIFAKDSLTVSGAITAKGGRGDDGESQSGTSGGFPIGGEVGGGGGGSGGLLMLVSPTITVSSPDPDLGLSVKYGEGGFPAGNGEVQGNEDDGDLVRGGHGGYGYMRLDAATLDTSDGTITVDASGAFEGDFAEWCWESEPIPEAPCDTDADGDGFMAWECGGPDCDDDNADIHPGATEIAADEIDQDCDGLDLCNDVTWIQGGLKTTGCTTGGGGVPGTFATLGLALALLVRRRS